MADEHVPLEKRSKDDLVTLANQAIACYISAGSRTNELSDVVTRFIQTQDFGDCPENVQEAIKEACESRGEDLQRTLVEESAMVGISPETQVKNFDWSLRYSLSSSNVRNLKDRVLLLSFGMKNGSENTIEFNESDLDSLISQFETIEKDLNRLKNLKI